LLAGDEEPKIKSQAAQSVSAFQLITLKRHGKVEKIVTDGLRSYPAVMRELGNLDRREMVVGSTTEPKTAICPSDDESGRCSVFGK